MLLPAALRHLLLSCFFFWGGIFHYLIPRIDLSFNMFLLQEHEQSWVANHEFKYRCELDVTEHLGQTALWNAWGGSSALTLRWKHLPSHILQILKCMFVNRRSCFMVLQGFYKDVSQPRSCFHSFIWLLSIGSCKAGDFIEAGAKLWGYGMVNNRSTGIGFLACDHNRSTGIIQFVNENWMMPLFFTTEIGKISLFNYPLYLRIKIF